MFSRAAHTPPLKEFLREYWLSITVPIGIVIVGIAVLALTNNGPGGNFIYNF